MPVVLTWNPPNEFQNFEKELFNTAHNKGCCTKVHKTDEVQTEKSWKPTADILSETEYYSIRVDLPGLSKEDIHLSFEKGMLTLLGERKQVDKEKTVRNERIFGEFERKFKMSSEIQSDLITAEFSNGELHITVPKKISEERVISISNN